MSRLPLRPTLVAVLQALTAGARHGFDVISATGLPSGTVYPALARLEHEGFVESRWEDHKVAQKEIDELVDIVATTKKDIVEAR